VISGIRQQQVQIGGIVRSANGLWMSQIARNLTDAVDGFFAGKRYLIHDRDPLYTREFLSILANTGIQSVKLPPRSPNLNAYAERFVRTIKESCLEQMIFFGEDSLRNAIRHFVAHYHVEAEPSRTEKPTHRSDRNNWNEYRDCANAATSRRNAQLLLPPGGMIEFFCERTC
jgi:transposase InsO family protein